MSFFSWNHSQGLHPLKQTASLPLKIDVFFPKRKPDRLPTIHFQVLLLLVSGRVTWNLKHHPGSKKGTSYKTSFHHFLGSKCDFCVSVLCFLGPRLPKTKRQEVFGHRDWLTTSLMNFALRNDEWPASFTKYAFCYYTKQRDQKEGMFKLYAILP